MSRDLKERIAALQKEQEQLRARAQQLQSQYNTQERKTNDRRKYVIGAIVLKDIENNDGLRNYLVKVLASAAERDKALFQDLLIAKPTTQSN